MSFSRARVSHPQDDIVGTNSALNFTAILHFFISNCLSYGIVVGSSILKLPQILKVWKSQSAEGISLTANLVELLAYVISTSWSIVHRFAFRDFGENIFILIQLILLILLVAKLQKRLRTACAFLTLEMTLFYFFSRGILPRVMHECLLSGQILLNISSRVPQIFLNYKTSSTGQLSFLTCFLAFGGGVARTMTTALNVSWSKGKAVMLLQFSIAALLNMILITQILYYSYIKKRVAHPTPDFKASSDKLKKQY